MKLDPHTQPTMGLAPKGAGHEPECCEMAISQDADHSGACPMVLLCNDCGDTNGSGMGGGIGTSQASPPPVPAISSHHRLCFVRFHATRGHGSSCEMRGLVGLHSRDGKPTRPATYCRAAEILSDNRAARTSQPSSPFITARM